MFSFGRAVIIIWLPGLVTCGVPTAKEDPLNPLMIAENYARSHYPRQAPEGSERQWFVEDHGDIWIVEFGAQGGTGGGIRMAIAKHDGRVLGSEQTQ